MAQKRDPAQAALACFEQIRAGYTAFRKPFDRLTRRAVRHFAERDWQHMRMDTVERLDLYEQAVHRTQNGIEQSLGRTAFAKPIWRAAKQLYDVHCDTQPDADIKRTFFNSVSRRMLNTFGVDPQVEFVDPPQPPGGPETCRELVQTYRFDPFNPESVQMLLNRYDLRRPFFRPDQDAALCANRINGILAGQTAAVHVDMVREPFFRDTRAYLIGRILVGRRTTPVVFAVGNSAKGLFVDALLLTAEQVRVLFSFTRAYFQVDVQKPLELVQFLETLMPNKRRSELYSVLGFHKHGKTVLYQDLLNHRRVCGQDRFQTAAGQRGMVMIAFNMPRDDLIYKLIRDRFASPKQTTRKQVMEKYDYVFKHDRAGRLVDVQTFENLKIEKCCFEDHLLSEIASQAQKTASIQKDQVLLHHVYIERRVTPLDVFLQNADPASAAAAVVDYGRAIKDLAAVDVFPGDMLIKNFGITRLGRVVFYDYDELCPLTLCNFRSLPWARHYDELLDADPWFRIGPHDVFPEELLTFLGLSREMKQVFTRHHGDLLTPDFWLRAQQNITEGKPASILPYSAAERLRPGDDQIS